MANICYNVGNFEKKLNKNVRNLSTKAILHFDEVFVPLHWQLFKKLDKFCKFGLKQIM